MSDKFNGFSQDEINRLSGAKHKKVTNLDTMKSAMFRGHGGIRRMTDKNQQQKMSEAKQLKITSNILNSEKNNNRFSEKLKNQLNDSLESINPDNSMSKSLEEALFYQPLKIRKEKSEIKSSTTGEKHLQGHEQINSKNHMNTQCSHTEDSSILKLSTEMDSHVSSSSCSNSSEDTSILHSLQCDSKKTSAATAPISFTVESPFKGISLKDFESHRKMIEEQNRQKKEILYKAIEQHSQKTAAEARKIEEIKAELSKLDNDLALDVALLRKQIDNACVQFATVEKHYMKIESQFLKAKIDLHNAAEKKELLTEHLCTVIAHNEDRKAQKLTELMEKVGLATNREYESPTST